MSEFPATDLAANDRPAVPNDAADGDYWHAMIDEAEAGTFLGLTKRTMQAMRQRGDGPKYVVISSRCLRYRRADLRIWADGRLRTSTADPGPEGTQ